jgi:hypothetical protein
LNSGKFVRSFTFTISIMLDLYLHSYLLVSLILLLVCTFYTVLLPVRCLPVCTIYRTFLSTLLLLSSWLSTLLFFLSVFMFFNAI